MKKFFVVLAILFIGILLAGCTSQPAAPVATPTPTPVPTTIATEVPTAVPTTEVVIVVVNTTPNATPTATPTPRPTFTITFNNDLTVIPDPAMIRIPVGTQVTWVNNDEFKPHGVQAIDVPTGDYFGGMGTMTIPYGQPYTVIFDKEGAYNYKTVFQQEMNCVIIVYK
jgi:plastocyanin